MNEKQMKDFANVMAKFVADCNQIGVKVDNVDFTVEMERESALRAKEETEEFNLREWIEHGEPMKMAELEKKVIIRALKKNGHVKEAAAELQISERSLWRKMKIYGLAPDGERRK